MSDPYLILGLEPGAEDGEIRQAYLKAIRRCPPEKDPDRFQALHQAYEAVKTRKRRLHYRLFDSQLPDPETLFERACRSSSPGRPDVALFAAVLRSTAAKVPADP
ncbi:MAG: DnaJ domain-containing protein [Gammaproteobacteria bacterium]